MMVFYSKSNSSIIIFEYKVFIDCHFYSTHCIKNVHHIIEKQAKKFGLIWMNKWHRKMDIINSL